MLSEFKKLIEDYKETYWLIKENAEAIPADQRASMYENLKVLYNRDCAQLEGVEALKAERERAKHENELKEIEEVKKLKNAEIDAAYKLKHCKINQETEIKSAELAQQAELKKAKIEAETEIQKDIIQKDIGLKKAVETAIAESKKNRLVPIEKHHKRHFFSIRWQPNEAYMLAEEKLKLESEKSLLERKNEVIKLRAELTGSDELEMAICTIFNEYINAKRGRKAKAAARTLTELVQPLCAILASREQAFEDAIAQLSECNVNKEDRDNSQENISFSAEESKEPQANPSEQQMSLPIEEVQQVEIKKPPRKRVRKKINVSETGNVTDKEGEEVD